ncbi:MAG: efflux RND transporter permease subunit [Paracoccaceae bacterium]|nr:efflux RND transporter permease subunit [Paracoccaceae bacterium]
MAESLQPGPRGIIAYFTRHRTAANLLLVIMVVLGLTAMTQIRSQFFPDVVIENVQVSVRWDGAGPEDMDIAVIALLEPVLLDIEGVESSRSTAREGQATIRLEFEPGWDMARAADDVKVAVDGVTDLPDGIDDPVVRRSAWRDRVTDVIIYGPVSTDQLGRFTDEFVAKLFRRGITRTTIRGIAAPEIVIEVPEAALIRNDISLREIAVAVGAEVEADPAGDVAGGAARVRTGIEKRAAEEIGRVAVRSLPDGSKVRVEDIGRVLESGAGRDRSYWVGEHPAVSIRVDRADFGDAISMQAEVAAVAEEMQETLPEGVTITLIRTRAEAISERLEVLFDNGLLGLLLVLGLLFLFLNARTAFWVAAGIPVAMLAAVAFMYAAGLTINMVSLFGLIICLGFVVDDAIVVGEHADFRHRRLGESPAMAAERAAIRMAPLVFAATVTTVIAFFGLTLVGGRFGDLIGDLPFTVIVVLLASLAECFLILPNHMSHALVSVGRRRWYDWPNMLFNRLFSWFRDQMFRRIMRGVLALRYPILAGAVLLLAWQGALLIRGDVVFRFFNAPETGSVSGNISMLPGASREDTLVMVRELQRAVTVTSEAFEQRYGVDPVTFTLAEVGGNTGRGLAGADSKDTDLLGSIAVELIDADSRPYTSFAFVAALQDEVKRHPLLEALSFRGWRRGPGGDSLSVELTGSDATTLKAAAVATQEALLPYPEVSALEDDLAFDKEELILDLTPQGRALGFTIDGIGAELRGRLNGINAARFASGSRTSEIIVRLPESELTADFLDRTRMRTSAGDYVPLSDIVSVSTRLGFSTIRRVNGLRVVTVTGDVSEDDPERAEAVGKELAERILPEIAAEYGVAFRISGQAEQQEQFLNDALFGYTLCLLGMYLALAWIFASWTRPLVVLAVIPFGLVGAIYGHHQWAVPFSIFSVIGLIGLSGIIINDAIVLVSTVNEYARSRALAPAIVDAACDRFRPVLLTTLTTVLGLLPLLYESSRQALFLKPTVITLSYGLGFGLFIVLLLVPSLLGVQADVGRLLTSLRRGLVDRRTGVVGRLVLATVSLKSAAIIAGTTGYLAFTSELHPALAERIPPTVPAAAGAALAMVTGIVLVLVVWIPLSVLLLRGVRRSSRRAT